jgi:hypothetical protein
LVRDVVQHGECLRHGCQWPSMCVACAGGEREGRTVAMPIQPGRRRRGSSNPPARERKVDVRYALHIFVVRSRTMVA